MVVVSDAVIRISRPNKDATAAQKNLRKKTKRAEQRRTRKVLVYNKAVGNATRHTVSPNPAVVEIQQTKLQRRNGSLAAKERAERNNMRMARSNAKFLADVKPSRKVRRAAEHS